MTNAADQGQQFLDRLRAIETAVRDRTGRMPRWIVTPAASAVEVASVELELGMPLPEEVDSLYRATGYVSCFVDLVAPISSLVEVTAEYQVHMGEVHEYFGEVIWGPRPEGNVVVIGSCRSFVNLCEVDGPSAGRLSMLDVRDDFGYRFVADSVGQLLDAWLAAMQRGLFELGVHDTVLAPSGRFEAELRELAHDLGVGPAAFGIFHLTPEQVDRMHAGAPDYWRR